ncbi:GNAT family N-acetyltransferase [Kineococcus gynurae]|uniref:GNAT family N-acetyltransferase n=1 Tax=Kineococcus gynurae TaxID=452979 RepID=A0ABV5LSN5_9ACTN
MSIPADLRPSVPVVLEGRRVRLEPLTVDHLAELRAASADGEVWRRWYTTVPTPEGMAAEIDRRLALQAAGTMAPWVLRGTATGRVCGMTTFMNIVTEHHKLEIGSTWLAGSAQGSGINAEAKLLLLTRAFETLACVKVEFRTHWHNHQSREAIARLGAKQDGVLRDDQVLPDGSLRDTVVFSVLAAEWPAVRAGLRSRLERRERGEQVDGGEGTRR